jgi:cutinase
VEVVFARGTFEPPGIGTTGDAFVDALRSHVGAKSVDVYPVNYPASLDFQTAADGVIDASNKVRDMAANCPNTKMVLGGYSQGAAVIGYITTDALPAGFVPPAGITGPMPPEVADHVAAVALFGKPSNGFLQTINTTAPPITVGHLYSGKTVDLCIPEDPICSPSGGDNGAHTLYGTNGMTAQAADFAVRHLGSNGVSDHS